MFLGDTDTGPGLHLENHCLRLSDKYKCYLAFQTDPTQASRNKLPKHKNIRQFPELRPVSWTVNSAVAQDSIHVQKGPVLGV